MVGGSKRIALLRILQSTCCFVLLVAAGCGSVRTQTGFYEPVYTNMRGGNFEAAAANIEKAKESGKYGHKDRLVYYLDAGVLYHYAGHFDSSNVRLHAAESAAEELFTKSISRGATSFLLNDNALEYAGEDYEVLYSNLLKCLNYLRQNSFDDAFVEVRRANLKLDLLEQKYADAAKQSEQASQDDTNSYDIKYDVEKVRFHNDAFARYLSMHMYAAEGMWDDARIDYDFLLDAFRSQPHVYNFDMPAVNYSREKGKTILSVVGLAGMSPTKEAWELRLRTEKDLNLIQVLYTDTGGDETEYGHIPADIGVDLYAKFAIPRIEPRPSTISRAIVFADGQPIGELQVIEDVSMVAQETFRAKKSLIYFKTIARALGKALANYKLKQEVEGGDKLLSWLKKAAVDVVTDLTEGADLRCCRTLPGRILVGDFELAPGIYDLRIEFRGADDQVLDVTHYPKFPVNDRGLNLIEAISLN